MDLPYLFAPRARGKTYYYYRRAGQRVPIREAFGTPEFVAAWRRIHDGFETPSAAAGGTAPGSLAHLIAAYKAAPEFTELAVKTRYEHARYLDILNRAHGRLTVAVMPRDFVLGLRDKHAARPRTANYFVAILRRLMAFAMDRPTTFGVTANPAARIKPLREGPGHRPWLPHEIETFRESAPAEMTLALLLALGTGQRLGDVLRMAWGNYSGGTIEVVQGKTGERLWVPVHRDLRQTLDNTPKRGAVILTTKTGRPWRKDHFSHAWRRAILAAGLDGLTFHGLRKTAGSWLIDAGCTDREAMDILGHRTHAMVGRYVAGRDRKASAKSAIRKLERHMNKQGKV